ncbi:MAG: hypothetical protein FWD17_19425 [Polyangiaceae bacterium]|nr:hypothetical protein [Polyangiaceae bacterium]
MRLHFVAVTIAAGIVLCVAGAGCSATVTNATPGCSPDDTLVCAGGGDGWTCAAGDRPDNQDSSLSCSDPQPDGPNDDFCCVSWTFGSSCTPDGTLLCAGYGFVCAAGDDPTSLDPTLSCSAPTADGPNDDFCCD